MTATVATASLETGQPIIDDELKGKDFFNVTANPMLTFKSRSVRPTGADTAEMTGDVTLNGITKPVTLAVTLRANDDPALKWSAGAKQFVAKTQIKRSAFGMTSFEFLVGDDIEIEIDAVVRTRD